MYLAQGKIIESFVSIDTISLTESQLNLMNDIALSVFAFYLVSIILIMLGILVIMYHWKTEKSFLNSTNSIKQYYYIFKSTTSFILLDPFSKKIFFISLILYFVVSLFLNNSIIYNPFASSILIDDFFLPSIYIIGCCGNPATFPIIDVHLTNFLGFKFLPANIILPLSYALLVSLTFGTVSLFRSKKKGILSNSIGGKTCSVTSLGLLTGFFISCPSCTSNILVTYVLGSTLLSSSSVLIMSYQPVIIIFSFALTFGVLIFLMKKFLYQT
ncbi:MAG: hypothetical protein R2685_02540 [Candidatus Nitrosocosmicus sp.]|nr:hypothetical protein [Candidatus Nitrosocosmicus sp.]